MTLRALLRRAGYLAALFAVAAALFGVVGLALLLVLPLAGVPTRVTNAASLLAAMVAAGVVLVAGLSRERGRS